MKHYLDTFLPFCYLQDNPLLLGLCQDSKNEIMVSYATYLLTGNTLLAKSIKVATAKLYVKAVVDYFTSRKQFNPTLTDKGEKIQALEKVWTEGIRWEKMPNRAEPLTPEMVQYLVEAGSKSPSHSALSAYADWAVLSLQTGFRISEYAQTHSAQHKSLTSKVSVNIDGSSQAFIASDFKFLGHNRRPLTNKKRQLAEFVHITWRFQKNGVNGEEIPFARNDKRPLFCPVRAAFRIIQRAEHFKQEAHLPIAICQSPTKKVTGLSYLTSVYVSKMLKKAAIEAHGITSKKDLKKFTPHSPRVGACVLLDLMGRNSDYIKKRLRWRSDSYQDYLRHIHTVATEHVATLNSYFKKYENVVLL